MSPKQPLMFTKPSRPVAANEADDAKAAELEQRVEARGNGHVLDDAASSQAHEPAEPQAHDAAAAQPRKPARSRAREAAPSSARSGTQDAPYLRADGQATRSTTVHMPVELHRKLRIAAAERGVHMSAIINEAVRDWFRAKR